MPINQLDKELIDRYLNSELSPAEREEFDRKMLQEEFKKHVDEAEIVLQAIRNEGRSQLRSTLRDWDASSRRPKARTVRMRTLVGVAASLLLLMVMYFFTRPTIDAQLMADSLLEPYPNVIAPLQKSADEEPARYQQAFQFYEMGYYGKAEDIFATLDQSDEAVSFFRALNALLDDHPEKASLDLEEMANDEVHRFTKPAKWYLAIALLKLDRKKDAKAVFEEIAADQESPFRKDAETLLNRI